ncbi:MAG: hypothetical protein P8Y65_06245 [Campylobacterales bacterium]
MKLLKIIVMITGIAALTAILIIMLMGYSITKGAEAIFEKANADVTQTVTHADGKTVVIVPLHNTTGIKYEHIALCTPPERQNDHFFKQVIAEQASSTSTMCIDGFCTVTIDIPEHQEKPDAVFMYVKDSSGACKKSALTTGGRFTVLEQKATIEFTDELKQALGISGDTYEISSEHSTGRMAWQLMGTRKVTFTYNEKPASDVLFINGKTVAKIQFL